MNRIVGWLALGDSKAGHHPLAACEFKTPHWKADHQALYVDGPLALSATQRFVTPECDAGLMPYREESSGCVINADVYLTNRETLCRSLGSDPKTADAALILQAYLKWGEQCTHHLAGHFGFLIWDPRSQHLFAAVDPFAHCPLFYAHRPEHFLMLANECSPFHALRPSLTLNSQRLMDFANDVYSTTETAYEEIHKLPAGHQLVATAKGLRLSRYWDWKKQRKKLPLKTRQEFYEAFQGQFKRAVEKCSRRIGPLTSQLSGGLDSSAVTAQAAGLLAKQQETLSAFTILPNGLSGESFRPGWHYHELPRILPLLEQNPNIEHHIYTAEPSTNIFEKLAPLQRCFDQPLRNINNLDWTLACYEQVLARNGRVLLIGAGGNGTISWEGRSRAKILKDFYVAMKSKILGLRHRWIRNFHETMLSGRLTEPLRASVYPLQLWYGVRRLDPTQELALAAFCYNVPQWIYQRGDKPLEQRLLTREGLRPLLPETIAQNPNRGEQGADWYLHYNLHREKWRDQLLALTPNAARLLWQSYDREKILTLFEDYPVLDQPPDRQVTNDLCLRLLRCLSAGLFLNSPR